MIAAIKRFDIGASAVFLLNPSTCMMKDALQHPIVSFNQSLCVHRLFQNLQVHMAIELRNGGLLHIVVQRF